MLVKSRASGSQASFRESLRHLREGSSDFCFVLDALDDGTNRRNRTYRAASEAQLTEWIECLVAASLIAQ